jgi:hypothetical protein
MIEGERLCRLHDCAVDRCHLLCHSADLVLWYSTVPEHSQGEVQIWELL